MMKIAWKLLFLISAISCAGFGLDAWQVFCDENRAFNGTPSPISTPRVLGFLQMPLMVSVILTLGFALLAIASLAIVINNKLQPRLRRDRVTPEKT